MNVDHSRRKSAEKIAFQNPHEPGQRDPIHLRLLQRGDVGALGLIVQFRAEFSRRDESGVDAPLLRPRQNSGVGHVAKHDRHFGGNLPGLTRPGNGRQVRAFARTENAQSKFSAHSPLLLTERRFKTRRKVGCAKPFPALTFLL